eukprot:jgi/Bigna1/79921/fgenesh1_pg.66_\
MFRSKEQRQRSFKKGIDVDDARRRRDEIAINLRKKSREEQLQKRRNRGANAKSVDNKENSRGNINTGANNADLRKLPDFVRAVRGSDANLRHEAVAGIRKILSVEKMPPIQQVLNTGVAMDLINILRDNRTMSKTQFEACWALTNIASGTSADTAALVKMGAVDVFIAHLRNNDPTVREQAVWALGNVCGDSSTHRDMVLKRDDALKALVDLCNHNGSNITTIRNCAWTLSNLCRGKPKPNFTQIRKILPTLRMLLTSQDKDVLTDTCWALSYVSDDSTDNNEQIQAVIDMGCIPLLVRYLRSSEPSIQTPALRTIGNVVTGSDQQTQVVITNGAIPALRELLRHSKKSIRKETCWTLSNITAGNRSQIECVLKQNVIPDLVHILSHGEHDVQKEATWAIANALSGGSKQQLDEIIGHAVIGPLCNILTGVDARVIIVALDALIKILEHGAKNSYDSTNRYADEVESCGGLDKIEELQRHDNEDIYEKVVSIIKTYFETEDDDEDVGANLNPVLNENANQFAFGTSTAVGGGSSNGFGQGFTF